LKYTKNLGNQKKTTKVNFGKSRKIPKSPTIRKMY